MTDVLPPGFEVEQVPNPQQRGAASLPQGFQVQEPDPDEAQPTGPTQVNPVSLTDFLVSGATFGASDEVGSAGAGTGAALVNAARSIAEGELPSMTAMADAFEEARKRNLAGLRAGMDQFRERNPVLATGAEIVGAIPMALSAAPRLAATTLPGRVTQGGLVGGAQGGVFGFLSGRGGEENRLTSGAIGTGVGGGVGAAAPFVGAGVRNVTRRVAQGRAANALGVPRAAADTLQRAADADDTLTGAGARRIAQAGDDAMLADAGPNLRSLLDTATQRSGPAATRAQQAIDQRVTRASQRLTQTLDDTLGQPQGVRTAERGIRQSTSVARSEAYQRAYAQPIDYTSDVGVRINDIVANRVPMSAIKSANKLMRAEGFQSQQILAKVADDGTVTFQRLPDVRQLDFITRGLQEAADRASGQGRLGGTTPLGRAFGNLKSEMRALMREAVPEYGVALDTAADAISRRNALRLGQRALSARVPRDEFAEEVAGMSLAERQAVAQGVRSQLDDAMANVRRAITDGNMDAREAVRAVQSLTTRASREKLELLLGRQRSAQLFTSIDETISALDLRAAVAANSRTFARTQLNEAIEAQTNEGVVNALRSGEPIDAGRRAIQAIGGRTRQTDSVLRMRRSMHWWVH